MKTKNISIILYLIAAILIIIPASIVIITDVGFNSVFSKIFVSTATLLIILGKTLTVMKKNRGDKSIPVDIGIISGWIIAFILNLLD